MSETMKSLGFVYKTKDEKKALSQSCRIGGHNECRCCGKEPDGYACKGSGISILVAKECFEKSRALVRCARKLLDQPQGEDCHA